jgi:hypothetical protein
MYLDRKLKEFYFLNLRKIEEKKKKKKKKKSAMSKTVVPGKPDPPQKPEFRPDF